MLEFTKTADLFFLRKIIIRHKRIGYDLMQHSACLVINPITFDNFAALFNDRASDSLIAPT